MPVMMVMTKEEKGALQDELRRLPLQSGVATMIEPFHFAGSPPRCL